MSNGRPLATGCHLMGSSHSPMPSTATNQQGLTATTTASPGKRCTKCGEVKPVTAFQRRADRAGGLRGECRTCRQPPKTPAQLKRIAERRRERKDQTRTPREQLAEMTVQDLIWVLDGIPDGEEFDEWRALVNRAVSKIRKSGRRTQSAAAEAVTAALQKPFNRDGATAADLASDTDIPEQIVENILKSLISNNAVYRFPKDVPPEAQFAQEIWLYKLTGSRPRSPLVLP